MGLLQSTSRVTSSSLNKQSCHKHSLQSKVPEFQKYDFSPRVYRVQISVKTDIPHKIHSKLHNDFYAQNV